MPRTTLADLSSTLEALERVTGVEPCRCPSRVRTGDAASSSTAAPATSARGSASVSYETSCGPPSVAPACCERTASDDGANTSRRLLPRLNDNAG